MQNNFGFNLFMETSAKTGFNAQNLFVEAGKILYNEISHYNEIAKQPSVHLRKKVELKQQQRENDQNNNNNNKKCC